MSQCPICRKAAPARPLNPSSPFCSERCRQVDLGKWLNEEYAVPAEESDEPDGGMDMEGKNAS
jgi:endogenous inhibitor of DNA gyrase (YacG/DUF329 family)